MPGPSPPASQREDSMKMPPSPELYSELSFTRVLRSDALAPMKCDLLLSPLREQSELGFDPGLWCQKNKGVFTLRLFESEAGQGLPEVSQPGPLVDRDDQQENDTMRKQACNLNGRFFPCSKHTVQGTRCSLFLPCAERGVFQRRVLEDEEVSSFLTQRVM